MCNQNKMYQYHYVAFNDCSASFENSPKQKMNEWIDKNFLNVLKSLNIASKCYGWIFLNFCWALNKRLAFIRQIRFLKIFQPYSLLFPRK